MPLDLTSILGGVPEGGPTDYVEERVDAQGHHTRKEVHRGDGWETIEITTDGDIDVGSMLGQIMQQQFANMGRRHQNSADSSEMPVMVLGRGTPVFIDDDLDEVEEEVPAEIIAQFERMRQEREAFFQNIIMGAGSPFGSFFSNSKPTEGATVQDDHALVPS